MPTAVKRSRMHSSGIGKALSIHDLSRHTLMLSFLAASSIVITFSVTERYEHGEMETIALRYAALASFSSMPCLFLSARNSSSLVRARSVKPYSRVVLDMKSITILVFPWKPDGSIVPTISPTSTTGYFLPGPSSRSPYRLGTRSPSS